VVQGLLSIVDTGRGWLANLASLKWARPGGVNLAGPAVVILVVAYAAPQLGRDVSGIPFWATWLLATVAAVTAVKLLCRVRPVPGSAADPGASTLAGRAAAARSGFDFRRLPILQLSLVIGVVVSWLLYDLLLWQPVSHLYDMNVYLGSAERWMNGGQAYMTATMTAWPANARSDFLLYPPPLLPAFALLSQLPSGLVAICWTALQVACWYKAFRLLGLSRSVSLILLAFPPVMIGLESGNVAGLTFLLFAAAVRAGGTLVIDGIFKVQSGIPVLWLLRQRRWRALIAGTAVFAAIVLVTLPLVGLDEWRAWWAGLGYRAASQPLADALFGYSYAKDLPAPVYVAGSAALTIVALAFRGRRGLAALGLASVFASPALWPHGFVFALPAVLMLESGTAVWLVLGAGAFGPNMWLLFGGGWLAVLAARRVPAGRLHPLIGTDGPWPRALGTRRAGTGRGSRAGDAAENAEGHVSAPLVKVRTGPVSTEPPPEPVR
jgi:hypothetical protein